MGNVLRGIRIIFAFLILLAFSLAFCDVTGHLTGCFAPLAKIQFISVLTSASWGILAFHIVLTLLLGRVYCSLLCPLGITQDLIAWLVSRKKKYRYHYQKGKRVCRILFFVLFFVLLGLGCTVYAALLDPYSSFGRIASTFLSPTYQWMNHLLAGWSAYSGNFLFYDHEYIFPAGSVILVAIVVFLLIIVMSTLSGRLYCNTICPVGTFLGVFSRHSFLRIRINPVLCNHCGKCERLCKSSCINSKGETIDNDRCVVCFNCMRACPQNAISFSYPILPKEAEKKNELRVNTRFSTDFTVNEKIFSRRNLLSFFSLMFCLGNDHPDGESKTKLKKNFDGGFAPLTHRVAPKRTVPILPLGSEDLRHFQRRCSACQLCVTACPNHILRPHNGLNRLQPSLSFEIGYCRPECVRCTEVCPSGAIQTTSKADKSAIQIGYAVWVRDACIVVTDGVDCGNCARHCPTEAIEMVSTLSSDLSGRKIPTIDPERCIGCGRCEYLCPARPTSAIYVEGVDKQRII